MRRLWFVTLMSVGVAAAVAACGDGDDGVATGGADAGDGGTTASSEAGPGTDATTGPSDAATDVTDALVDANYFYPDGSCTDLALPDAAAPIVNVPLQGPTAAGGTIADGEYVLTKIEHFTGDGGASGNTGSARAVVRFFGSRFESVDDLNGFNPSGGSFTTNGDKVHFTEMCPLVADRPIGSYTADSTHYMGIAKAGPTTIVSTFTKR